MLTHRLECCLNAMQNRCHSHTVLHRLQCAISNHKHFVLRCLRHFVLRCLRQQLWLQVKVAMFSLLIVSDKRVPQLTHTLPVQVLLKGCARCVGFAWKNVKNSVNWERLQEPVHLFHTCLQPNCLLSIPFWVTATICSAKIAESLNTCELQIMSFESAKAW